MVVIMVFIAILLVGVVLLITHGDSEDMFGFGMLLIVIGFLGFVTSSFEKDITSEWVPKDVFVMKSPRLVVVDDGSKLWEMVNYKDVVSINDSTIFLFEETTNLWGTINYEGIKLQNK